MADAALKEGTMLQWGRGSLPGCNFGEENVCCRNCELQWGRGSLPGCNVPRVKDGTHLTSFNGAGDHSPDVTASGGHEPGRPAGFNGAGDHSPDVTMRLRVCSFWLVMLQWGRGSLPGCNAMSNRTTSAPTSFNGAGDHSPDVTRPSLRHACAGCRFNGAGDHSPDVTR